jgi:hypothetical protein
MSELEAPGLILDPPLDLTSGPAPAASGARWGSLREMGGWWGLLRFLPGAIRQAFSEREQPGGLPVVEPGQVRPAELPDVDFGDSYPTADHTPAATAEAPVADASVAEVPVAEVSDLDVAASAEAPEQGYEARLAADEAEMGAYVASGQYDADLALITDVGTGVDAAESGAGAAVNGHAVQVSAEAAAAEAGAELGEVGL